MARRPGLWVEIGVNLALLTILVSVLDAGVFYVVTQAVVSDTATGLAEGAAETIAGELSTVPEAEWRRVVERHVRGGIRDVAVYDASGETRVGAGGASAVQIQQVLVTREPATVFEGDGVRSLAAVRSGGRAVGVVQVGLGPEAVSHPVWVVIGVHAVVSGALIVAFGVSLFRRAVVGPIGRMGDATRRIAEGEFGVTVDEDAPQELASLAHALNQMSLALSDYQERTADQLTRLAAANEAITRAQDALVRSEKLASVGRLASGLAHEIGNPLAAVRGYLELVEGERSVDPRATELVRRAQAEVERMHSLLGNLLDFARVAERRVEPVSAAALLRGAVDTVQAQPALRNLAVDVAAAPDAVFPGDLDTLHQALVNLVLNAAAAGASRVALRAEVTPEATEITCTDDGEGIPAENLSRLFDPFFTTRAPGGGTGLGLAIVHRIVEQHGGRVEVHSAPGQGATFRLRLDGSRPKAG